MNSEDLFSEDPARQITVGELLDYSDNNKNVADKLPIRLCLSGRKTMSDFFQTKTVYCESVNNRQSEVWMKIDNVKYPVTIGFVLGLLSFAKNS